MDPTSQAVHAIAAGLPHWERVLVVVAHPDDESFGLGGVIAALTAAGSVVHVLCLTKGEASTLGAAPDLADRRAAELALAARRLGVAATTLVDLPDGHLADLEEGELRQHVVRAVADHRPDGLLVFDPVGGVTGHPDHRAASLAALAVAEAYGLPVLGWGLPLDVAATLNDELGASFAGHRDLDVTVRVDRPTQRRAIEAHASQAVPGSVLWRRLELLGDHEHLRWLAGPGPVPVTTGDHRRAAAGAAASAAAGVVAVLVLGAGALTGCSGSMTGSGPSPVTSSTGAAARAQNGSAVTVDAFAAAAQRDGVTVLDVRTPEEFAQGHLSGAVNLDVSSADFTARLLELDRTRPYAVYCHSGNRSAVAVRAMTSAGFTDVVHLAGGVTAWTEAGRGLESS